MALRQLMFKLFWPWLHYIYRPHAHFHSKLSAVPLHQLPLSKYHTKRGGGDRESQQFAIASFRKWRSISSTDRYPVTNITQDNPTPDFVTIDKLLHFNGRITSVIKTEERTIQSQQVIKAPHRLLHIK